MTDKAHLLAFAEDPDLSLVLGPDEERIVTDRFVITFSPGEHYWSTSVARVRFGGTDVPDGVEEIRDAIRGRARRAAAWTVGPSATPSDLLRHLLRLGLRAESDEGSVILVLTDPPDTRPSTLEVRRVLTFEEHMAAIEVAIEGFGFPEDDAVDERRRARETFDVEREAGNVIRAVAFDDDRPVATGYACISPFGMYFGGAATTPSDRGRGGMSCVVETLWAEAVRRGTPALVTFAGAMSRSPLQRLGFRPVGRVDHLVDRFE